MIGLAQRRDWARRQGNPAWFWPEIDPRSWHEALGQIGRSLHDMLNGESVRPLNCEPGAIGLAGYTSGMGPMLGWWIEQGSFPQPEKQIGDLLATHLRNNRRRMAQLVEQGVRITEKFAQRGIGVTVLKGAHTALTYFPEPGTRPMSDLDLLVGAGDVPAAQDVLLAAGFMLESQKIRESCWRMVGTASEPKSLHWVDAGDPWSVDLHHSLDVPVDSAVPPTRLSASDAMSPASRWAANHHATTLGNPMLLLHLALHAGAGLRSMTMLRQLELVIVIRKDHAAGFLDWDEFLRLARDSGSLGYAYPALSLCRQLARDCVPETVLEACRMEVPPRALRIIDGLTPATAHRVDRCSVSEHFMWTRGMSGWTRKLTADLFPAAGPPQSTFSIYASRGWRLLRGRYSW